MSKTTERFWGEVIESMVSDYGFTLTEAKKTLKAWKKTAIKDFKCLDGKVIKAKELEEVFMHWGADKLARSFKKRKDFLSAK